MSIKNVLNLLIFVNSVNFNFFSKSQGEIWSNGLGSLHDRVLRIFLTVLGVRFTTKYARLRILHALRVDTTMLLYMVVVVVVVDVAAAACLHYLVRDEKIIIRVSSTWRRSICINDRQSSGSLPRDLIPVASCPLDKIRDAEARAQVVIYIYIHTYIQVYTRFTRPDYSPC